MRSLNSPSGGSRIVDMPPMTKLSRLGADHLAGVLAIIFALACGAGPFILLYALDKWGPF
jgi:hypothetical protein